MHCNTVFHWIGDHGKDLVGHLAIDVLLCVRVCAACRLLPLHKRLSPVLLDSTTDKLLVRIQT